jgi:hypothetical protein
LVLQAAADLRVCQFLEEFKLSPALVAVGKDDRCQPLAVDFTRVFPICRKDASTPAIAGNFLDLRQPEHIMARTVGIENDGAKLLQFFRDKCFSRRNAAKEAQSFHWELSFSEYVKGDPQFKVLPAAN